MRYNTDEMLKVCKMQGWNDGAMQELSAIHLCSLSNFGANFGKAKWFQIISRHFDSLVLRSRRYAKRCSFAFAL